MFFFFQYAQPFLFFSFSTSTFFSLSLSKHQQTTKTKKKETDLLATLPAFRSFSRNGLDAAVLSCCHGDNDKKQQSLLPRAVADELFSLCKRNMQAAYDAAWGWSDSAKRAELSHGAARFLLVVEKSVVDGAAAAAAAENAAAASSDGDEGRKTTSSDENKIIMPLLEQDPSKILAYVHYRFEADEATNEPILYVYEIQLREGPETRRKGLGRFLMQLLELAARQRGLRAITLTVQDSNAAAAALYASLGYSRDPGSPCPLEEPEAGYTILTKALPAPRQPLVAASGGGGGGGNGKSTAATAPTSKAAAATASPAPGRGKGVAAAASELASATLSSPAAAAVGGQRG